MSFKCFLYLSDHSDLLRNFILAEIIVGILAKPLKTTVLENKFIVLHNEVQLKKIMNTHV